MKALVCLDARFLHCCVLLVLVPVKLLLQELVDSVRYLISVIIDLYFARVASHVVHRDGYQLVEKRGSEFFAWCLWSYFEPQIVEQAFSFETRMLEFIFKLNASRAVKWLYFQRLNVEYFHSFVEKLCAREKTEVKRQLLCMLASQKSFEIQYSQFCQATKTNNLLAVVLEEHLDTSEEILNF